MMPPGRWSDPHAKINVIVGMGDMAASDQLNACLTTYSLGSCVGVSVYDPVVKVGGLLHAMLPEGGMNAARAKERPYMFVDTGLPALFHTVYALGGVKSRLIVKLAGGAELLGDNKVFNIGARNVEMVERMLSRNGVKLVAKDTGGKDVRTVRLDLDTGEVTLLITGKGSIAL
ncbi:MAG: chemotaxis protein CheD [Verrucomicrobiota bacterium]